MTRLPQWVTATTKQEVVTNMGQLTMKERADKIRLAIIAMSDEDLTFADNESFGTDFKSLTDLILEMSKKAQKDTPF